MTGILRFGNSSFERVWSQYGVATFEGRGVLEHPRAVELIAEDTVMHQKRRIKIDMERSTFYI